MEVETAGLSSLIPMRVLGLTSLFCSLEQIALKEKSKSIVALDAFSAWLVLYVAWRP